MTDQPKLTTEERIAQRQAREDALRRQLADLQLDGPFNFSNGFDAMSAMFGGGQDRFAICLRCGSIVVLNDPEETEGGAQIERGVRLHLAWHEELGR